MCKYAKVPQHTINSRKIKKIHINYPLSPRKNPTTYNQQIQQQTQGLLSPKAQVLSTPSGQTTRSFDPL